MTLLELVNVDRIDTALDKVIPVHALRQLLSALQFRDVNTLLHSRRVCMLSVGIAVRLGWEKDDIKSMEIAALMHDLGKVGIPDHVLHKPGKLSPDEAEYINDLHKVGMGILQVCGAHDDVIEIIAESHGFSDVSQNVSQSSSLGARILTVADAFDSLTTKQRYRDAYTKQEACEILEKQSGKQFDRNVVSALNRWLESDDAKEFLKQSELAQSQQAAFPVDPEAEAVSGQICQLFNYFYSWETLYEAYYLVDSNEKIVMWSLGAEELTGKTAQDMIGTTWNRSSISQSAGLSTDPLKVCMSSGVPNCHLMSVQDREGNVRELNVQSLPILDAGNGVAAVAELVYDGKQSKQNAGQFRELKHQATRDPLTGLLNRGELDAKLDELHAQWKSDSSIVYSVVFMDLDHFKAINDRLSHEVGDRVLIDVAQLLQDELYSNEVIGRYGGEEFVIVCPDADLQTGIERAERLRRALGNTEIANRSDLRVTASFGVAQVEKGDKVAATVKRADNALYDAKNSGRDRTCHRLLNDKRGEKNRKAEEKARLWTHESDFLVRVTADILIIKMKGYVEDSGAKLISVNGQKIVVEVGRPTFFGGWGDTFSRQPVRITIDVLEGPESDTARKKLLKTLVEPIQKPSKSEDFHERALHAIEELRSYLMAE